MFIQFTSRAFRKLLSVYAFSYFPFGSEARIWGLIASVPDHCLSFYLTRCLYDCGALKRFGCTRFLYVSTTVTRRYV